MVSSLMNRMLCDFQQSQDSFFVIRVLRVSGRKFIFTPFFTLALERVERGTSKRKINSLVKTPFLAILYGGVQTMPVIYSAGQVTRSVDLFFFSGIRADQIRSIAVI